MAVKDNIRIVGMSSVYREGDELFVPVHGRLRRLLNHPGKARAVMVIVEFDDYTATVVGHVIRRGQKFEKVML